MAEFDGEKALKEWTGLLELIQVGAYEERGARHYASGTYPDDGIEEAADRLETQAWQHGLQFVYHHDGDRWSLEPMSPEELAAYKAATEQEQPGDDLESIEMSLQETNEQINRQDG